MSKGVSRFGSLKSQIRAAAGHRAGSWTSLSRDGEMGHASIPPPCRANVADCRCVHHPVSLKPDFPVLLRRLLAFVIVIAMVWQGLELARTASRGDIDAQASATASTITDQVHEEADRDLCGDTDRCDCAGHMQHHATATLDAPSSMGTEGALAERILFDSSLMRSADTGMPLRPPKATPVAFV